MRTTVFSHSLVPFQASPASRQSRIGLGWWRYHFFVKDNYGKARPKNVNVHTYCTKNFRCDQTIRHQRHRPAGILIVFPSLLLILLRHRWVKFLVGAMLSINRKGSTLVSEREFRCYMHSEPLGLDFRRPVVRKALAAAYAGVRIEAREAVRTS
jgi:hypothetical protein